MHEYTRAALMTISNTCWLRFLCFWWRKSTFHEMYYPRNT